MQTDDKKLLFKITVLLSVFTVLVCVMLRLYVDNLIEDQESDMKYYLSQVSHKNAEIIDRNVKIHYNTFVDISDYLSTGNNFDKVYLTTFFKDMLPGTNYIRLLFIDKSGVGFGVDKNGGVIENQDYSGSAFFKQAVKGQEYASSPHDDTLSGEKIIDFALPIYSSGEIIGVFCGASTAQAVSADFNAEVFSGLGYTQIADTDGNILFDFSGNRSRTNIFKDQSISAPKNIIKENLKAGKSGNYTIQINGVKNYVFYVPIELNGWYVFNVSPVSDLEIKDEQQIVVFSLILMITLVILTVILLTILYFITRRHNRTIKNLAYIDPLTQANNMNKFEEELKEKSVGSQYAIVAYNIRNFKGYNELFGFNNGDKLLKKIASIFSKVLWKDEVFARDAADKFYLLLKYSTVDELNSRLENILHEISHCMDDETKKYKILSCAGIYLISDKDSSKEANALIDYSIIALSNIKSIHENTITFYDQELHNKQLNKNNIEKIMRSSLENEDFLVFLQPKINLETEELAGAEALVRWNHPDEGLVYPNSFIPIFEENGFITKVDLYMLEKVVQLQRKWLDQNLQCVPISVNQSRLLLYSPSYIKTVTDIVDSYRVPHELIEMELTETAVFENKDKVIKTFKKFRDLGFQTSMDDFGSGYSSLNMLKDLEFDVIKLDKGFFSDTSRSGKGKEIVESIIKLINSLNMTSLAEGLETKEQIEFLKDAKCALVQGYYYAKPMPVEEFEAKYFPKLKRSAS